MPVTLSSGSTTLTLEFCRVEVSAWRSSKKPLEYPGVDGHGKLDMGRRARAITCSGFIEDALDGPTKGEDIEELDDSVLYLFDTGIGGRSFDKVELLDARTFNWRKTVGAGGELQSCEFSIELQEIRE